ncbi:MAG: rubrerythrin, partial [Myxococcales bacterium]|nr:rubrerythrin [Myxococcales bacterium]
KSQATRSYLYFARQADIEGYTDVGGLFRDTAEAETGHAHGHLDHLKSAGDPATDKPIGSTDKNLVAAVTGETYEYTEMYPGMARTARDEGFSDVAEWFETLAKAEKSHAGRFQKALDELPTL